MSPIQTAADDSRYRRIPGEVWIVWGLALALRLGLIAISHSVDHGLVDHPANQSDCRHYLDYGQWFAGNAADPGRTFAQRDRGWPFLLGFVFRWTGRSVVLGQIVAAFVAVSGVFFLYLLARYWLSHRWSLLACVLWVFDPSFVGQSCFPLTENLATPLLIAALWMLVWAERSNSTWRAVAAAGLLVVSAHVRSAIFAVGLPFVLLGIGWCGSWRRRIVLAGLMTMIVGCGWLASSYVTYRMFGVFTPNTHSYSLWSHAAAKILMQQGAVASMPEGKRVLEESARRDFSGEHSGHDYLSAKRDRDRAFCLGHPYLLSRNFCQAFVGAALMPERWSVPALIGVHRSGGIWQSGGSLWDRGRMVLERWGLVVCGYLIVHAAFMGLIWVGMVLSIPRILTGVGRSISLLLLFSIGAVLVTGAMNVEATPRYRLPAMPMMCVLAGLGFERLSDVWRGGRRSTGLGD